MTDSVALAAAIRRSIEKVQGRKMRRSAYVTSQIAMSLDHARCEGMAEGNRRSVKAESDLKAEREDRKKLEESARVLAERNSRSHRLILRLKEARKLDAEIAALERSFLEDALRDKADRASGQKWVPAPWPGSGDLALAA